MTPHFWRHYTVTQLQAGVANRTDALGKLAKKPTLTPNEVALQQTYTQDIREMRHTLAERERVAIEVKEALNQQEAP